MGRGESEGTKAVQSNADRQKFAPGRSSESVEVEGVTLVSVSTSVFSYDGNDSRLLQVSSDGSGSSVTYGAARFVNSVASWGSAEDSAVSFSLLCASTDGRVLAAGSASAGVPEFGVPSAGAHAGAGSGAGLLDPYGWPSLGVVAPAVPSAQGASSGAAPVLPDSLVGVSAASGVVLGSSGFEVLGARVVDSRVARFTAPDSLVAPVGAGWGADSFSLVGGNPVSLVDPWGLSPVPVEDFDKYRESRADAGVSGWLNRNTDAIQTALTVVGVVASVAGLIFTGPVALVVVGIVAGASLAAASSISSNRDENGRVNWGRVGSDAAIGGVFGAIGGGIAGQGRNAMIALGRTKAVGALEQFVTSGWSKGAQVFATRASVHAIPEVAANFVGGFENLAHDAVNGRSGDKAQYSIREHIVSTVSGGIFGGISHDTRALSGSLAKVARKSIPGVNRLSRPSVQRAFDTMTPATLKMLQGAVDTLGKKGDKSIVDWGLVVASGVKAGHSGFKSYHEGSSVRDPRTVAQLGMSHDTSLSRIAYVRNPEKNQALLEQRVKDLDNTMLDIGRDRVVSMGKVIVDYQDSKLKK